MALWNENFCKYNGAMALLVIVIALALMFTGHFSRAPYLVLIVLYLAFAISYAAIVAAKDGKSLFSNKELDEREKSVVLEIERHSQYAVWAASGIVVGQYVHRMDELTCIPASYFEVGIGIYLWMAFGLTSIVGHYVHRRS